MSDVKFTIRVEDKSKEWDRIVRQNTKLSKKPLVIQSGLFSQAGNSRNPNTNIAYRGIIQEFGVDGKIPERPFMRFTYDANKNNIFRYSSKQIDDFLFKGKSQDTAAHKIGKYVANKIKHTISQSNKYTPLSPLTIKRRGGNRNVSNITESVRTYEPGLSPSNKGDSKRVSGRLTMGATARPLLDTYRMINSVTHKIRRFK